MSKYIATRAIRGANALVTEADVMLNKALAEKGADTPISFPNTAYFLPTILGMTGRTIEKIGDLKAVMDYTRGLLHPVPAGRRWTPYLGETLDSGVATLLAAETIEAVRFAYGLQPEPMPGFKLAGGTSFTSPDSNGGDGANLDGHLNGPIDDIQLRSWGIQLVDGRMPGFAAIVGCAKSNEVAVKIVRELQRRNILCFLSGNVNGRSIIHQLQEEGVELGYDTYTVPFGTDTISAIYALGFATRSALTFGGLKPGQSREILLYNKERVFAFVLALGEVDDLKYAAAAGAINFGFPVIADTVIPEILPTGVTTYEHVVSMPFDAIDGNDDLEKAERLVQKCIEVRGVKIKVSNVDVPVPYGSAFEGEVVRKADLRVEFGGKKSRAFEFLQMAKLDEVTDGKIEVIGTDFSQVPAQGSMDLGIIIKVAGRQMQQDFEPVLERQVHYFVNGASGIQHVGQRDIAWIRISNAAADKGFSLESFGKILHARFHEDFGAIVDKVQVTIVTEPALHAEWLDKARAAYDFRNKRLADMTDTAVDAFYSCTLCVPEGEEIILPDGSFMPVEKLVETVVDERDLTVLTFGNAQLESRPVGEVFINPAPQKLVKMTLENGNSLTLTANHKVLVDRPDSLSWAPISELTTADFVVTGKQTSLVNWPVSSDANYIIDYLPDEYKVSDDEFYAGLQEAILLQCESLAEAARRFELDYDTLCGVFRRDSHRCFTIGETRKIVAALGFDWHELRKHIRGFKPNIRLLETRLDEDLLYLVGLVASDGCISWREDRNTTQVQFTNTEPTLIGRFCEIHQRFLGTKPAVYDWVAPPEAKIKGKRPVNVAYTYNPVLAHLLTGLGLGQTEGEGGWRGETISGLPSNLVAAFLRGLFDGDGDVSVSDSGFRIGFTTKGHREAHHIYLLLKKLGIDSTITSRSNPTPIHRIRTRGKQAFVLFQNLVGSRHPEKQAKMNIELPLDAVGRRHDIAPLKCGKLLQDLLAQQSDEIQTTHLPIDYKTLQSWLQGQRHPSRKALKQLLEGLQPRIDTDDPLYQELLAWSRTDLSFERVKKIEQVGKDGEKVYNFSVANTHNYLVNGIVVKNCQSFAPNHVCIISPERLGLCGAYNYLDAAASYYINPTGPNQPIKLGRQLDDRKGYWQGTNDYAAIGSHGVVQEVSMYSIMENPMTACLTEDAEVLIDGQLTKIGDFVNAYRKSPCQSNLHTLDDNGRLAQSKLLGVHKNPAPEELIRIETKSGLELTLTPNHEVAVDRWEQNGHGPWARADSLRAGVRLYALKHLRLDNLAKGQDQVLPYKAGKALAELQESHAVLSPSTLFYYKTGRSRPVADNLRLVIEEAPETSAALTPWLESDFFLDTVTRVETLKNDGKFDYVYNVSLLDINSYLANGIHVKNCGCFECIVMLIPEANGVMVLSREDTAMTPAGMTFSTLAGIAGGGLQTPGVMGVGKFYLISPKFISSDGGFKRVVWMSSVLKESMADEFKAVCEREGDPDFMSRIADASNATTVEELLAYLEAHNHPAMAMEPMF